MGKNRLQYQLLHKRFAQQKSLTTLNSSKPKTRLRDISRDKSKVLQQNQLSPPLIIQESEETLRGFTPSKKGRRVKGGSIVKPKICKTKKTNLGVSTFKNFIKSTDNKSTTSIERDFNQKLEHVKRFINEIRTEAQLKTNEDNDQPSRINEKNRKEESPPRSVPTLLVDLRKPLDKWDIESNSLRQEFNSEINSAYKSMLNFIDEIK